MKTRRRVPWAGWKNEQPGYRERTFMLKKCGKKMFFRKKQVLSYL